MKRGLLKTDLWNGAHSCGCWAMLPLQQISDQLCGLFYRMLLTVWKTKLWTTWAYNMAVCPRQVTDVVYLRQQKQKPTFGLPHTIQYPNPAWCRSRRERPKRLCGFGWHFAFQRWGTFCLLLFDWSDKNKWALTFTRVVFIRRVFITYLPTRKNKRYWEDIWCFNKKE